MRSVLPVATYVAVTAKLGQLAEVLRWTGAISDTRRAGDYYRIVDDDRLLWGGRITTDTHEPPRLRDMMRSDILAVYPTLGEVGIARRQRALKREASRLDERGPCAEDRRRGRLVQIQTARIVARQHAERLHSRVLEPRQAKRFAP